MLTLLRSIISNKRVTNTSSFQFLGIQKQFSDSSHEEIRFSFKNVFTVDVRFELTTNDPWSVDDAICEGISPLGYFFCKRDINSVILSALCRSKNSAVVLNRKITVWWYNEIFFSYGCHKKTVASGRGVGGEPDRKSRRSAEPCV